MIVGQQRQLVCTERQSLLALTDVDLQRCRALFFHVRYQCRVEDDIDRNW